MGFVNIFYNYVFAGMAFSCQGFGNLVWIVFVVTKFVHSADYQAWLLFVFLEINFHFQQRINPLGYKQATF